MKAEITVLSAGAVGPGVGRLAEAFRQGTGHVVTLALATAPALRTRLTGGEPVDVVIAPPAVLDDLVRAGKAAAADSVTVGRVGVGVAVRAGAPRPSIATVEDFKHSVLGADSVVYNRASTGLYLERLFERLAIAERLSAKATRYPDGAAVLEHVLAGTGVEIGFGAITEIIEYGKKGLVLVGPLPPPIQNYTTYAATVVLGSPAAELARAFVRSLTTPAARAVFAAAGVE